MVRLARLRATGLRAGVALMYHRVAPLPGDPAREFVPALSVAQFDAQLAHLRRCFDVVPAGDLQAAAGARRRGGRFPVALTFDDDTLTHLDHAAPVLRRHGLTATFFLNGHALDAPRAYWWELLQAASDQGHPWADLLPGPVLTRAREVDGPHPGPYGVSVAVEELTPAMRRELAAGLSARLGDGAPGGGLRAAQVRELAAAGFTIGFHGHGHEPMSLLGPAELAEELDGGRSALEEAAGRPLATIAYPHGRVNADVAAAARQRGFRAGFTVRAEAVTPQDDPLLLGRIDGAVASLQAFQAALVHALARAR